MHEKAESGSTRVLAGRVTPLVERHRAAFIARTLVVRWQVQPQDSIYLRVVWWNRLDQTKTKRPVKE